MQGSELESWLRLALTPGIGNASARALLGTFGLPTEIFAQSPSAFSRLLTPTQILALSEGPSNLSPLLATTLDWLQEAPQCRRVLTLGDPMYPPALLHTEDPPLMLYAIAPPHFWSGLQWPEHALAMVGSRNPTPQGLENARHFARDLVQRGICIVSGMALGIDGAAHEGALEAHGPGIQTIAVVGTGLDRVYPARHRSLAHQIAGHGVLLSEYPLGTPPLAHHFPQRNRILCGLSSGTLVVEAALQSGSLITARLCIEQGKEVFAIPGSIHSPQSKGCHALIRQGAKLVECAQDILEEIPAWLGHPSSGANTGSPALEQAGEEACAVLSAMGFDPVQFDLLQARTGWTTPALQVRLMELELRQQVARLPGGMFQRIGLT
ncbi:MAG: DNA-protecting protein DprA [Rhodoferax sp.]|nr:MAG: DNA-protecting protein DprA [Rhodoferax sp.]